MKLLMTGVRGLPTVNQTAAGAYFIANAIGSFAYVLNSSKGRDKFLALMQYITQLYKSCMKDYLEKNAIRQWPISVRNAKAIETSLSSSRKIFRFLRFLEVSVEIENLIRFSNKSIPLKLI
jgi:hypothetical protein